MSQPYLDLSRLDQRLEKLQKLRNFLSDPEVAEWIREMVVVGCCPPANHEEFVVSVESQPLSLDAVTTPVDLTRIEAPKPLNDSPPVWWSEVA